MNSATEVGMGVIGAGAMGRVYCECLTRHVRGARLVALAGGRRADELARDYGATLSPRVEALVARDDVAAVIIASPETAHREQTLLAATHGKHVLVEKPMAPDVAQCDEMIAACARAGVQLMVVKHWRFRGVHVRAKAMLASGGFGPIREVRNHTQAALASSLELVARKPFYVDPRGGGLLMGWAVHNLDWVRFLVGGDPRHLAPFEPLRAHALLGATHLAAQLEWPGGAVAHVQVSIDLPAAPRADHIFRTEIVTENGALDLDGYGALRIARGAEWETVWTQPKFDPRNATDPLRLEAYTAMLQAFIFAARNGTRPPITGEDGRAAVAMFRAARAARK